MKVKLVSWNVRGLNDREKRRFVKSDSQLECRHSLTSGIKIRRGY